MKHIDINLLENNIGQILGVNQNPRDLEISGFELTKKSIAQFPKMLSVRQLVVVEHDAKYVIIGGNQRLRAMVALGYTEAPCIVVDWSVDEINEFIIKDNLSYGEWNYEHLANEWDTKLLIDWGLDLPVDFGTIEDQMIEGITDEDDIPEIPKDPITKRGDVWLLGNHRLMCGDSTLIDDVEFLMEGKKSDMVWTDPPYGINYESKSHGKLKNDDLGGSELANLICNIFMFNKEEADIYICVSPIMQLPFLNFIDDNQKKVEAVIVWNKKIPGLGFMRYRRQCEFILYIQGAKFSKNEKSDFDLWEITRDNGSDYVHPTQKPVVLPERALLNSSKPGDIVLDLFGGSGSTLLACEKNKRINFSMELDEKYCDVIIKRWQDFTGKDAILESTRQKFNELN